MGSLIRAVLSKWFFIVYFILGISYFVVFPLIVPWISWQKSLSVTLSLMTASGPYSFKEIIEPHGSLWLLAWLIHIASWLLIPALISLLITEAKEDIRRDQVADKAFEHVLLELVGSSAKGRELRERVDEFVEDLKKSAEPRQTVSVSENNSETPIERRKETNP